MISSWSFRYKIPEGSTTIIVSDTEPPHLQIFIGKSGTVTSALAYTVASLTNKLLESHPIETVMDLLDGIKTDSGSWNNNGSWCTGLAEALSFALLEFSRKRRVKNGE